VTFHEQLRILQFNNQNLHNAKIIHITNMLYIFFEKNYIFFLLYLINIDNHIVINMIKNI
jgi:hypothetical protein